MMKSQLFYNSFQIKDHRVISVFTGDSKLGLTHVLAREAVGAGKNALVISFSPMQYPVEGKVIMADSAQVILSMIENGPPDNYYLASKIEEDLLNPMPYEQLMDLVARLPDHSKLFIHIDSIDKKQSEYLKIIDKILLICEINYNTLRATFDALSGKDQVDVDHPFEEKIHAQMKRLISKNCPVFKSKMKFDKKVCYIGQIKSLFDTNSILPVARQMKSSYSCRVFLGHIQTYLLKEI